VIEKDIENLIARYPDEFFPNKGFKLICQQFTVEGRRIDILFEDDLKRKIIVEVKKGILPRDAVGQIAEYYGLLKIKHLDEVYRMILCANIIPKERTLLIEQNNIECKELGITKIIEIAKKHQYTFLDDQPLSKYNESFVKEGGSINNDIFNNEKVNVWIFQGNPERYDVLNALSNKEIEKGFHWLVTKHKQDIKTGDLGLIWLCGPDAGIYAITRITKSPKLMREYDFERQYWMNAAEENIEAFRVEMILLKNMVNCPLFRRNFINLPGLEELSIKRQSQGTNFPVRNYEWQIISKHIEK
jgi:hypothetical protein